MYDFRQAISKTIKKAMGTLMLTKRNKDHFSKETRTPSLTRWCSAHQIRHCSLEHHQLCLPYKAQNVQNFAVKAAHGKARGYGHVTPLSNEAKWMKIKYLVTFHPAVTSFKHKVKVLPDHVLSLPRVNTVTNPWRGAAQPQCPATVTDTGGGALSALSPGCELTAR